MDCDWRKLLTGQCDKKTFAEFYLPATFLVLFSWTVARIFHCLDNDYFINFCRISRQGNPKLNPAGSGYFTFGAGLESIILVFYHIFGYRRLAGQYKLPARLFLCCGFVAAAGLFMVGVCPEGSGGVIQKLHNIGTGMAFGGFGSAIGFAFMALSLKLRDHESWPSITQVCVLFLIIFHFAVLMLFTSGAPVLQWLGFSAILIWQLVFFLILPEHVEDQRELK